MNAELDLTEATAALGRLAMGANYAHDVRLLRLALERLKALSTPPADDVREALDLDSLEANARAATPGPWQALTTGARGGDHWYIVDNDESIAHISANDGEDEDRREPNARYMASASPDVVLALVERLRAAEVRPHGTVTLPADDVRPWRPEDGDTPTRVVGRIRSTNGGVRYPPTRSGSDGRTAGNEVLCPTCYHAKWLGREVGPSTPPADDVREALDWVEKTLALPVYESPVPDSYGDGVRETLRTVEKLLRREVRPHGTVTDAETNEAPQPLLNEFYVSGLRKAIAIIQGEDYPLSNGLARVASMVSDIEDEIAMEEEVHLREADVVVRWLTGFAERGIVTIGGKGGALEAAREVHP